MRIILCVLSIVVLWPAFAVGQAATKRLNVVIVSVETFDDPAYHNALLEQNIHAAGANLARFFREHFPSATITTLSSRGDTTSAHLTEFFKGTFPVLANGNVTLLFLLSHGEAVPAPHPVFGSDLRILASDTPPNNLLGKTVSLTTDIVGNLQGLLPGSFVFGFIDTCHSGAAKSIGLSVDAAIKNALGTRMMLMASSLSDQLSFQASFSQALIDLWNTRSSISAGQACTAPELSQALIRDRIRQILGDAFPLGENEGYPTVLLHFQGAMCLETFSSDSAIVELINATADSFVASFTEAGGVKLRQPIEPHDAVPVRVNRSMYDLVVYRNNESILAKHLDLTKDSFVYEVLGSPDGRQLGVGFERAAAAAEAVNARPEDVNRARKLSYASYVAANEFAGAERVAQRITDSIESTWGQGKTVAFQPLATVRRRFVKAGDAKELGQTAQVLQQVGDWKNAASFYQAAAAKAASEKSPSQKPLAKEGYWSFVATGDYTAARHLREEYKISPQEICADCKQLEDQALKGNLLFRQIFANTATNKMLSTVATTTKTE